LRGAGIRIVSVNTDRYGGVCEWGITEATAENTTGAPIQAASFAKWLRSAHDQDNGAAWHDPPKVEQVGGRECAVTDSSYADGDRRRREVTWYWASGSQMVLVRWQGEKPVTGAPQAALDGLLNSFEAKTDRTAAAQSAKVGEPAGR
jgi:hypothetical protein